MATVKGSRKSRKSPVADEIKALAQSFTIRKEQIFATSLDVAARFSKRHDNVLQAIRKLECSDGFRLLHFQESSYLNEQGKPQPSYELTRDGFSMLAFGFTGKEAAAWREKYIAAFNWMEQELTRIKFQQQEPIWQQQRLESTVEFRLMNATLQMVREHLGKETKPHHYSNEARLINFALTGEFKPVDRDSATAEDLALLAKLELKNTLLMGLGQPYADRKTALQQYVTDSRTLHALPDKKPQLRLVA